MVCALLNLSARSLGATFIIVSIIFPGVIKEVLIDIRHYIAIVIII